MQCPQCQTWNNEEYEFCLNCGFRIDNDFETVINPNLNKKIPKQTYSNLILILLCFCAVLVVGGAIFLGIYFAASKNIESQPTKVNNNRLNNQQESSSLPGKNRPAQNISTPINTPKSQNFQIHCTILNNGKTVNLRKFCDVKNCENDPSTIFGEIADGISVTIASDFTVKSNKYVWRVISYNNDQYFVAASKLACEEGE